MSFSLEFAPDTELQWRELDLELQELILDEMENLAANPPSASKYYAYRDFVHDAGGMRHDVFLDQSAFCSFAFFLRFLLGAEFLDDGSDFGFPGKRFVLGGVVGRQRGDRGRDVHLL
jgi:hypothetical protein